MGDSPTLLCTPVSAIFVYAPKINNAAIVMLHCILGNVYNFSMPGPPEELTTSKKLISRE